MSVEISAIIAKDDPAYNKCPRCLRWTKNDGPLVGEREVICWRCQEVLCREHTNHEITKWVIEWRTEKNLPT